MAEMIQDIDKYQPVRTVLENIAFNDPEISINSLTDSEIDDIITAVQRHLDSRANYGADVSRLAHNPREKAFSDQWVKENIPHSWINSGWGILQDLFIHPVKGNPLAKTWTEIITNRDRKIVATVVQWLGTNCGMAFLHDALKACGLKIVQIDK